MKFEMTLRENLLLMQALRGYREDTAMNQRSCRRTAAFSTDLFWAERNRLARHLYRRLVKA